MSAIAFTILGEPASKANSRVLSVVGPKDNQRTILRKGNKALSYEKDALRQIPPKARVRLEGPVRVTLRIFYASQRPDLDGEVRQMVQAGVYRNDRQVREKHVFHALDKTNPRAEVVIEPLQAQQQSLPQELFDEAEVPF
jgi:Holliday junction resolvase RusA-like endonuclease